VPLGEVWLNKTCLLLAAQADFSSSSQAWEVSQVSLVSPKEQPQALPISLQAADSVEISVKINHQEVYLGVVAMHSQPQDLEATK
jgi:hypothetical protein